MSMNCDGAARSWVHGISRDRTAADLPVAALHQTKNSLTGAYRRALQACMFTNIQGMAQSAHMAWRAQKARVKKLRCSKTGGPSRKIARESLCRVCRVQCRPSHGTWTAAIYLASKRLELPV